MRKPLLSVALLPFLALASCPKVAETVEAVCAREARLHGLYLTFVAPRRPADRVAKAIAFHTKVQQLCAAGATIAQVNTAADAAEAARSE